MSTIHLGRFYTMILIFLKKNEKQWYHFTEPQYSTNKQQQQQNSSYWGEASNTAIKGKNMRIQNKVPITYQCYTSSCISYEWMSNMCGWKTELIIISPII